MAVEQNEIFYSVENQPDAKWDRKWAEGCGKGRGNLFYH